MSDSVSDASYALAVRDGDELLLTHIVRRTRTGIYLIFRRGNPWWDPHTSHHVSGKYHSKSFGHKAMESMRQKLDPNFYGTENLQTFSISLEDARAINVPCKAANFKDVFEIAANELGPDTHVSVDIADSIGKPIITPGARIIRQVVHNDAVPSILITVFKNPP